MTNYSRLTYQAILDITPLSLAVIPWGILTGAISIQIGLSPWQAQLMSLIVFAGAAQLSGITLMGNFASPLAIFGTTSVISARHLLYSITFREHVSALSLPWRAALAFVLTDEMFAVSQSNTQKTGQFSASYALIAGTVFYLIWNLATFIGIVAGNYFSNIHDLGLDFAIVATFIAMTFDKFKERPIAIAIVVSGISSILLKPALSDSHIIVAGLLGMCAGYLSANKPHHHLEPIKQQ